MENEKADRLRILLQEAMAPLLERIDHLDSEIRDLKSEIKELREK